MSLSSLRKTYGNGTRHEVINRAIRAECPGGNQCLDSLFALTVRLRDIPSDSPHYELINERLRERQAQRDRYAAELEAKHNVGPNTNRRRVTA